MGRTDRAKTACYNKKQQTIAKETIKPGSSFGSALAMVISYTARGKSNVIFRFFYLSGQ